MAHILIAEDNAQIAAHLCLALRKSGHRVTVATSSLDAWRAMTGGGHDVLLLDVVMPGIDGFAMAQKALGENPTMQIVFLTGFAAVAMDTQMTPSYAPAPFTSRPFHVRDMARRVNALLCGGLSDAASAHRPSLANGTVVYADFSAGKTMHEA